MVDLLENGAVLSYFDGWTRRVRSADLAVYMGQRQTRTARADSGAGNAASSRHPSGWPP
jgi:hypothetical protein